MVRDARLLLALAATSLAPRPARACGPGVHIAEASRALDLLAAEDPVWAERAAAPLASSYLALGSIAPDFEWPVGALSFGHGTSLGYHLLDVAEAEGSAEHALFALGLIAHMASDPACEVFHTPTLFASAPLGLFDLFESADGEDARAESEDVVEGLGDLVLGDWVSVVDVLFDFWLGGEESQARADAVVGWYCRAGAEHTGRDTDCELVFEQLGALLGRADDLLGGNTRDEAKGFIRLLTDDDPGRLVGFYASGMLELLGSQAGTRRPWYDREVARMVDSALSDPEFWAQYDAMADLGPRWTFDRVTRRLPADWPGWEPKAIVCGNLQSVMRFSPDYAVVPGLIVDSLRWTDPGGGELREVRPEDEGSELAAHVRLYSALPFSGEIRGVVRKDRPGLDAAGDEELGRAAVEVEIDPLEYAGTSRSELTIPFSAEPDGAVGYYVELYAEDLVRPWFTTSWDRLWSIGGLDLDGPAYRDHFGTYGHWPPSLPRRDPAGPAAALLVKVHVAPAGPGIPGARVEIDGATRSTGPNGVSVFDGLAAGPVSARVTAAGYAPPEGEVAGRLQGRDNTWLVVPLHADLRVESHADWLTPGGCLPFSWDPEPFADQAAHFWAWLAAGEVPEPVGEPADAGLTGEGELCGVGSIPDGQAVRVRLLPEYVDGTFGREALSEPAVVDRSPPDLEVLLSAPEATECVDLVPYLPTHHLCVEADDAQSDVEGAVEWRLGEAAPWQPAVRLPCEPADREAWVVDVSGSDRTPSAGLFLRAANRAGLTAELGPIALPVWGEEHPCPPEEAPASPRETESGCSQAPGPGLWLMSQRRN